MAHPVIQRTVEICQNLGQDTDVIGTVIPVPEVQKSVYLVHTRFIHGLVQDLALFRVDGVIFQILQQAGVDAGVYIPHGGHAAAGKPHERRGE